MTATPRVVVDTNSKGEFELGTMNYKNLNLMLNFK